MSDTRKDPAVLRCRLILAMPPIADGAEQLAEALAGGDVASVIFARGELGEVEYQDHCAALIPVAQAAGAAAIVCDDTRLLGRCDADGVLLTVPGNDFKAMTARFSPQKIVGFGGVKERHRALEIGEAYPDFMLFGKPGGDIRPEPHRKNLALAEWWSQLVEIPCAVMAGTALESVVECVASGAEFVVAGLAVFGHIEGPRVAVEKINALLDEHAVLLGDDG